MLEEKLKNLIIDRYGSVRQFSFKINIPYTTVDSILKRGIDNSNVGNVIKMCKALNISIDNLLDNKEIIYNLDDNLDDNINANKYAADKFKELRMKKNLTQEQLAEELKITQQQVARYENNMRQFKQDFLFKLAEYFNVSINDFFPPLKNGDIEMTDDEQELWAKDMLENKNAKILFDKINEHKNLTKEDAQKIADLIDIVTKDYEENHD